MTTVRTIRQYLELVQTTLANSLTETSPRAAQPPHIKPQLLPHQLAAMAAMREKEIGLQRGLQVGDETIYSSYAQYSDRAGVGKTLSVLGHVSQMATYPLRPEAQQVQAQILDPESSPAMFSLKPQPATENLFDTLIVVPFTIYRQWQDTITNETNLKATFLKSIRDMDKPTILQNMRGSHITLISNTLLNQFLGSLNIIAPGARWRRVFYDEADTIKLSCACAHPPANMTWYISSHYVNLLLADCHYSSHVLRLLPEPYVESFDEEIQTMVKYHVDHHPSIIFFKTASYSFFANHLKTKHHLRGHLVIRCSNNFIDSSINIQPVVETIIRCETPISHELVEYTIPTEVKEMLNAGDIKSALQRLGVPQHTPLTLVDAVTEFKMKDIQNLNRTLLLKNQENPVNTAITEAIMIKIRAIEAQVQGIKKRLEQISEDVCAICFDRPVSSVLTPCCSKVFCGECMIQWMIRTLACPLCREGIHPNQLKSIGDCSAPLQAKPQLPKKIDALLKILQESPEGKFLVFSRFDNPLSEIHETITDHYPSQTLQGNKDNIASQIADFETGITKVLLLNSRMAIAGMNLPSATHVILFHKMGMDEERDILGRAQRIGRTKQLQFIKLLNERE